MSKKVLIVEDNELNMQLFTDLLEAHGHLPVQTRDGIVALEIAAKEQPDLILMDIQLPHTSGIDIIKSMKAEPTTRHIPIVAVTAFAMSEDETRIRAAGCEDYISKPISIDHFLKVINKYLKGE